MYIGINLLVNDGALENTIALLNSVRAFNRELPVEVIPYDDNVTKISKILPQYNARFIDLDFIDKFSKEIHNIFHKHSFKRLEQIRKMACWFGSFDRFVYLDSDITVFDDLAKLTRCLSEYDFFNYDFQYKTGISCIFTKKALKERIFTDEEIKSVFNAGFWGSKKGVFTLDQLYQYFEECTENKKYLDLQYSDQAILNYIVIKHIPSRVNLINIDEYCAGSWAGSQNFQKIDNTLFDINTGKKLRYLHWAGGIQKLGKNYPYKDIWEYYRNLYQPAV